MTARMTAEEELEIAMREARSLVPGTYGQAGLEFLGIRETKNDTYYFFKETETEKYRYTSKSVEDFDRKMKEAERKRRKCYRRSGRW